MSFVTKASPPIMNPDIDYSVNPPAELDQLPAKNEKRNRLIGILVSLGVILALFAYVCSPFMVC